MQTALPTSPLGRTGMEITRVGFGAWAIGGEWQFGWGPQSDSDSVGGIRRAIALGINWIDTAAVYGLGHSEEVVARALADIPRAERPFVFTKCGMTWNPSDPAPEPERVATPASVRMEAIASLRRLQVERIDLFQVHWPPASGAPVAEYWDAMIALRDEGLVRAIGLSNHNTAQLDAAEARGRVDTLQPPFSLVRRDVGASEIPWCRAHHAGVLVYSPMQSGMLAGTFSQTRLAALPDSDWRKSSARFAPEKLAPALQLVDALRPLADARGVSPGAIAIAWTLTWPGVTGAIVGARNAGQVDGWIGAASIILTARELATIAGAIETTGAGSGPVAAPAR